MLAGPAGDRSLVLAAPIILYDHPMVAPESALQFCDATEMDEMLTLRTITLTEEEKRQVRGSDARGGRARRTRSTACARSCSSGCTARSGRCAAVARPAGRPTTGAGRDPAVVDEAVDASFEPETDVDPRGRRPGVARRRGAAAPGRASRGRAGHVPRRPPRTVEAVLSDLDGAPASRGSLDDLVADGVNPHGRYLYFAPDEVEPIGVDA